MLRHSMAGSLCAGLLAALLAGNALADAMPTPDEIYAAADAGHYAQAEQMIQQVLQQHPDSAKAHYIDAEILSREGKLPQARSELVRAEQLNPALSFAKPAAVHALEASLSVSGAAAAPHRTEFPWGLVLAGLAAIFIVFWIIRLISARNTTVIRGNPYQPNGMMNNPYGSGPVSPMGGPMGGGMGGGVMGGGTGSGIMSGLVTGAAVGAGMVAGEELAHHFLDGDHNAAPAGQNDDSWASNVNNDMGGNDFGLNDANSWDDGGSVGGGSDFGGGDDWS